MTAASPPLAVAAAQRVRRALGPYGYDALARTRAYHALRDPVWSLHPAAVQSRARLRALKNRRRGEAAVIVATGPSLNRTDLAKVRAAPVIIGLNRLYLGFDRLGLRPDYHVVTNLIMLEQSGEELARLGTPLIAAWAGRRHVPAARHVTFVRTWGGVGFAPSIVEGVWVGGTVTHVAL